MRPNIGEKEKNKHKKRKMNAGRGAVGKQAVVGMRQRGGKVKDWPVSETSKETLQKIINDKVDINATVYTDDHGEYKGISHRHEIVDHAAKKRVNGMAHTNGIESAWALLKRGHNGTFYGISTRHLHRNVHGFSFRLNDTIDRMKSLMFSMGGKRLHLQGFDPMTRRQTKSGRNISTRTIFTGDNLPVLRGMDSDSIDLIYLDPPFNSKHDYSAPIGTNKGEVAAHFTDTWTLDDIKEEWWAEIIDINLALYKTLDAVSTIESGIGGESSDKAYLVYMATRLIEMHRILKPTGSIYLHCDATMSHSLKLVMDCIFGKKNFRNEIIWAYKSGGASRKQFSKKHDTILFYGKTKETIFNVQKEKSYNRDFKPYRFKGVREFQDERGWYTTVNMKDVWKIDMVGRTAKERTGYPTQKPLQLLRRIVKASSNEGDVVLDPFCGCATTCVAAHDEKREWIGIDLSPAAYKLVKSRLKEELGIFGEVFQRKDIPVRDAPKPSKDIKHILYKKQKSKCTGCNMEFLPRNLTLDHIIAKSHGGADTDSNLQLLCGSCNSIKGNRPMEYLMVKLRGQGAIQQ